MSSPRSSSTKKNLDLRERREPVENKRWRGLNATVIEFLNVQKKVLHTFYQLPGVSCSKEDIERKKKERKKAIHLKVPI